MTNEPNEIDIENDETTETEEVDPAVQEVCEHLPGYQDYMRELRSEREGLTFGDY